MSKLEQPKIPVGIEEEKISNFEEYKYKYKLTKLSDDKFKGNHPNDIHAGKTWLSDRKQTPRIGEIFHFGPEEIWDRYNHIWTSLVTEVLEDGVFKTLNSTYKIEEI